MNSHYRQNSAKIDCWCRTYGSGANRSHSLSSGNWHFLPIHILLKNLLADFPFTIQLLKIQNNGHCKWMRGHRCDYNVHTDSLTRCSLSSSIQWAQPRFFFSPIWAHTSLFPSQVTSDWKDGREEEENVNPSFTKSGHQIENTKYSQKTQHGCVISDPTFFPSPLRVGCLNPA